jgi:hypothetical protein
MLGHHPKCPKSSGCKTGKRPVARPKQCVMHEGDHIMSLHVSTNTATANLSLSNGSFCPALSESFVVAVWSSDSIGLRLNGTIHLRQSTRP